MRDASNRRTTEERKLRRLGGRNEIDVDVRVLAATNRAADEAIEQGDLRSDLFYRLNVFHIHMPPLRTHLEDLPAMAEAMLIEMTTSTTSKRKSRRDSSSVFALMRCCVSAECR